MVFNLHSAIGYLNGGICFGQYYGCYHGVTVGVGLKGVGLNLGNLVNYVAIYYFAGHCYGNLLFLASLFGYGNVVKHYRYYGICFLLLSAGLGVGNGTCLGGGIFGSIVGYTHLHLHVVNLLIFLACFVGIYVNLWLALFNAPCGCGSACKVAYTGGFGGVVAHIGALVAAQGVAAFGHIQFAGFYAGCLYGKLLKGMCKQRFLQCQLCQLGRINGKCLAGCAGIVVVAAVNGNGYRWCLGGSSGCCVHVVSVANAVGAGGYCYVAVLYGYCGLISLSVVGVFAGAQCNPAGLYQLLVGSVNLYVGTLHSKRVGVSACSGKRNVVKHVNATCFGNCGKPFSANGFGGPTCVRCNNNRYGLSLLGNVHHVIAHLKGNGAVCIGANC